MGFSKLQDVDTIADNFNITNKKNLVWPHTALHSVHMTHNPTNKLTQKHSDRIPKIPSHNTPTDLSQEISTDIFKLTKSHRLTRKHTCIFPYAVYVYSDTE